MQEGVGAAVVQGGQMPPVRRLRKPKIKLEPGSVICQCNTCRETFRSPKGFDHHRTGPWEARRCMTLAEMAAVGMSQNKHGHWLLGGGTDADPA